MMMRLEELARLKDELSVAREEVLLQREDDGRVRVWASDVVTKVTEANRLISRAAENPAGGYADEVSKLLAQLTALKFRAPLPRDFAPRGLENELQRLSGWLIEEEAALIGVWGMGGIGKTTLLTELYYQCRPRFDCVVWLQASQEAKVEDLQAEFAKQVGVSLVKGKDSRGKASLLSRFVSRKKVLVMLDDLWGRVELGDIGISGCQVVFATRSKAVCSSMGARRTVKLAPLSWEKARRVFQDRAGTQTHPDIDSIVRECAGMPMALASCAQSLFSTWFPESGHSSVEILKTFAFRLVFPVLKPSFDSLPHPSMKSCLLYCALYPEHFDILKEELVDKWLCEGFLDAPDPITRGYDIIEALVDLSLLEDESEVETVRMHDVVRDMCLWIACEVEEEKWRYFVHSGNRFRKATPLGEWRDARRISLMLDKACSVQRRIEAGPPPCVSTLFLSRNSELEDMNGFLRCSKALRVLDLSETGLRVFPPEISELVCLQYLDISHTEVETLPREVMKLESLQCLNLEFTRKLRDMPGHLIASLKRLQVFRIIGSSLILDALAVEELERSESLKALSITIRDAGIYHKVLCSPKLSRCIQSLFVEDLGPPELPGTITGCFDGLRRLNISRCHYLQDLAWVARAVNLTKLIVRYCEKLEEISKEAGGDAFARVQEVELIGLPKLGRICREPKLFPCLNVVRVCGCPALRKLPLNSKSAQGRNLVIEGTVEWWIELEWEDEAARSAFKSSYDEIIWFNRRDGTCTAEDRNRLQLG